MRETRSRAQWWPLRGAAPALLGDYVLGTADKATFPGRPALDLATSALRGASQVMFASNPASGAIIIAATLLNDVLTGFCGVCALVVGTLAARLMGAPQHSVRAGMLGFNAHLVGLGFGTFGDRARPAALLLLSASGGAVAALLTVAMSSWRLPALTLPFNVTLLVTMGARFAFPALPFAPPAPLPALPQVARPSLPANATQPALSAAAGIEAVYVGVGQVFFASDLWAGWMVLLAVALHSRWSALAATAGSAVGALAAWVLAGGAPAERDAALTGLWGYNTALTAQALGGFFLTPSRPAALATVAGLALTLAASATLRSLLRLAGLPQGTLAFCAATTAVLSTLASSTSLQREQAPTAPEHHVMRNVAAWRLRKSARPASSGRAKALWRQLSGSRLPGRRPSVTPIARYATTAAELPQREGACPTAAPRRAWDAPGGPAKEGGGAPAAATASGPADSQPPSGSSAPAVAVNAGTLPGPPSADGVARDYAKATGALADPQALRFSHMLHGVLLAMTAGVLALVAVPAVKRSR